MTIRVYEILYSTGFIVALEVDETFANGGTTFAYAS